MDERTHLLDPLAQRDESLLLLVLSILLFSTLDGIFTLLLIETGEIREWNAFLATLIDTDLQLFATLKSALTAGGLFVLVVYVDRHLFRRIPVRSIIELIFVAYTLIMIYHFGLMIHLSG